MRNDYFAKTLQSTLKQCPCSYMFLDTVYLFSHKVFFSCLITSSLSCVQRFFLKWSWFKRTNLEHRLRISTESPKKGSNDTVFQHFVDELKHCNLDMQMDLQLLVPLFLCLYLVYLVFILHFRMVFFHNVFCCIPFVHEFAIFSP